MSSQSGNSSSIKDSEKISKVESSSRKQKKRPIKRKPYNQGARALEKIKRQINDQEFQWDKEEQFEIQRIIDEQIWDGKRYFLVKWKGFDISMSTWEDASKFTTMSELIIDFRRNKRGKRDKSISELANKMMNPYRATEVHGHFLYGDQPKEIIQTILQFDEDGKKTIYLQISWRNRLTNEGELRLQNSIIQSDIVFDHNPSFLLNYYQKSIELKSTIQ